MESDDHRVGCCRTVGRLGGGRLVRRRRRPLAPAAAGVVDPADPSRWHAGRRDKGPYSGRRCGAARLLGCRCRWADDHRGDQRLVVADRGGLHGWRSVVATTADDRCRLTASTFRPTQSIHPIGHRSTLAVARAHTATVADRSARVVPSADRVRTVGWRRLKGPAGLQLPGRIDGRGGHRGAVRVVAAGARG